MKCNICGGDLPRVGTCQLHCRYDKKSGAWNSGKMCHTGCAQRHWDAHHNTKNPRSLVSLANAK